MQKGHIHSSNVLVLFFFSRKKLQRKYFKTVNWPITLFICAFSCVQVLAEDGEVHVSLCNGQGGTPVDHPKREWHNSWQVAAMAAEAQLILSSVRPFESEKYQSYKCTGYR